MSDETPVSAAPAAAETTEQKTEAMEVDQAASTSDPKPSADGEVDATTKEPVNGASGVEAAAEADKGDAEMTGVTETGDQGATEEANGTPASDKKGRRKSSGVPEHKNKKTLQKKKSMKELHTNAKPGELFLIRMKGHPSWPSIIASDDMLPDVIDQKRPVTAPNKDGTWRRDEYAPEGKRHNDRTFAVMFLGTNEFAWIPVKDLDRLTPAECKDVSEKSKSKALIAAYAEAAEGRDLSYYEGLLKDHQDAVIEEENARAEREAEKAAKAEKKAKRKSGATVAADDDEMDVDEESSETKQKNKKRKKDAAEGDDNEKPAKTPKTTKLKLSNPKTPATGEKSAKKNGTGTKGTGKKKTPAKLADSDEAESPVPEKELTEEEKYAKREQEVKYCRHKLQRGLLTRDNVPSDEEVRVMSVYLEKLEDYTELEASIIRGTKIHKVLKAMLKLQSIPRDEEYSFKQRAHALLAKWNRVLSDNPSAGEDSAEPAATNGEAVTNGESKAAAEDDKSDEKKDDTETKTASATEQKTVEPKDDAETSTIGTKVEGAEEASKDVSKPAEKPAETAAEVKTDEPDVAAAPAEEYKPPVESTEAAASS